MSVRLYNTESTDEHELEDSLTPDGRSAKRQIEVAIENLVTSLADQSFNMRDAETLLLSAVQVGVSRAIIKRRRKEDGTW